MEIGKIPEAVLKRQVFGQLGCERDEVVVGAGVGEDCAVLKVPNDQVLVFSTDPITGTTKDIGKLSVVVTLNDLASSGAEPVGILLTILLPEKTEEKELSEIMSDIDVICKDMGISVLGGHTEVTPVVNKPLISITGVGKVNKDAYITTSGARPGMDIIVTKYVGLEGTSIIAKEKEDELKAHFPAHMIDNAKALDRHIPVVRDGMIAAKNGACAMHDVTEGGIFGALWEMAEASGVGIDIDLAKVPILQETIEITEYFNINPYKLISSGCMLIATDRSEQIQKALLEEGIDSACIGKATDSADRVVRYDENTLYLTPPSSDELYKVL